MTVTQEGKKEQWPAKLEYTPPQASTRPSGGGAFHRRGAGRCPTVLQIEHAQISLQIELERATAFYTRLPRLSRAADAVCCAVRTSFNLWRGGERYSSRNQHLRAQAPPATPSSPRVRFLVLLRRPSWWTAQPQDESHGIRFLDFLEIILMRFVVGSRVCSVEHCAGVEGSGSASGRQCARRW